MSAEGPDEIVPGSIPKKSFGDRLRGVKNAMLTREGLVGDYDYAFLFTPQIPFVKKSERAAPFFGLNDTMPIVLALILGFQHALSMLAGSTFMMT